jgi:hypothetical protein
MTHLFCQIFHQLRMFRHTPLLFALQTPLGSISGSASKRWRPFGLDKEQAQSPNSLTQGHLGSNAARNQESTYSRYPTRRRGRAIDWRIELEEIRAIRRVGAKRAKELKQCGPRSFTLTLTAHSASAELCEGSIRTVIGGDTVPGEARRASIGYYP